MRLHLDYETYSDADLKKVGTYAYANHPSTEILMLGWAIDEGTAHVWLPQKEAMPFELLSALTNNDCTVHAYNAPFEREISRRFLKVSPADARWRCTMAESYCLSFMGGLDDVLAATGIGVTKDKRGSALIQKFCKPQPKSRKVTRWTADNAPAEWTEFVNYCRQDVMVERQLWHYLDQRNAMSPEELAHWQLDQRINMNGLPLDLDLITHAAKLTHSEVKKLKAELQILTGLENPNSKPQMRMWLESKNIVLPNMQKATIEKLLATPSLNTNVKKVLELQQQVSKTSNGKWDALMRSHVRGKIHGAFQFNGASRTGRWAGRVFQPQNLPRSVVPFDERRAADLIASGQSEFLRVLWPNIMDCLSSSLRCAVTAPEGKVLCVSDYSSIESRILGWIANCTRINNVFANGLDTYKDFAVELFNVPYADVSKQQRGFAKPPTLGCGYRLGAKGLVKYAEQYGVEMDLKFAEFAVSKYREVHPEVVQFWYWCEEAVAAVTINRHLVVEQNRLKVWGDDEFLYITLPNGRKLCYHLPAMQMRRMPWGEEKPVFTYMGKDTYTHKWQRLDSHGGGLTENIVQAIARDVLMDGLVKASKNFYIVGHVHDEIIAPVDAENADAALQFLENLMGQPPAWAPDLLLGAAGFTSKRYMKD